MTNDKASDNLVAISGELKDIGKLDYTYFETLMRAMVALNLTSNKMVDLYETEVFQSVKEEMENGECDKK